jgi:hypothetical protein
MPRGNLDAGIIFSLRRGDRSRDACLRGNDPPVQRVGAIQVALANPSRTPYTISGL